MFSFILVICFFAFCYFLVRGFVSIFKDKKSIKLNLSLAIAFFIAIPFIAMTQLVGEKSSEEATPIKQDNTNAKTTTDIKQVEQPSKPTQKTSEQIAAERSNQLQIDSINLESIEARTTTNEKHLKGYYATNNQLDQCARDLVQIAMIMVDYGDKGQNPKEKELGKKAQVAGIKVESQCRKLYASTIEEQYIKSGFDISVKTTGNQDKTLTVRYALMSQPMVYKYRNEVKMGESAKRLGFNKLIYTNGFQSSLGETWTIDLSK